MNQLEIRFGTPLHLVVHTAEKQGAGKAVRAIFTLLIEGLTIKGENMASTMSSGSLAVVSVQWVDAGGNPAPVDGPTVWQSSDEAVVTATVATGNPLICNLASLGPIGTVSIQATADADMGTGVQSITAMLDLTVIAGQASGGVISFQATQ